MGRAEDEGRRDLNTPDISGVRLGAAGIPEHLRRDVRQAPKLEALARRYAELATRLGW